MATPIKPPPKPGAPAPPEGEARGKHATDQLAEDCALLEAEVEELKVKYEMYFLGVERSEPHRIRDDLKKKVLRLKERFTRNAGIRFRMQSLHARFISYERLWLRSTREKEEGTYRRDLFKARLHAQRPVGPAGVKGKKEILRHSQSEDVDLSDFGDEEAPPPAPPVVAPPLRPAVAAAPPRAATPAPPPPAAERPAPAVAPRAPAPAPRPAAAAAIDQQTRALYEAYVAARRRCNQDVAGITPDAIARTIARQTPEIMKTHKASRVEFKVEVKDGKAILKAVPKA